MSDYLEKFDDCLQGADPYCVGQCPFKMEILNFLEKAGRGSAKAAFKVYRNAVGFPNIVSKICPQPCKSVCPRKDHGGAIEMLELEKASIALTKDTSPTDYNIPPKKEHIAIIGCGAAGIGALLRLSTKKYHVEVFEKASVLGGSLRQAADPSVVDADIEEQLKFQDYQLHLNTEITSIEDLNDKNFDAVLVTTGVKGEDFGLLDAVSDKGDKYCCEYDGCGWFASGGLIGYDLINSIASGLAMGTVIDNYLKTKHQYYPLLATGTRLCDGMVSIHDDVPAVVPSGSAYTQEEFAAEAGRCANCQCDFCRQHCDILDYTNKWPRRVRDEVIATTLEGKTELKATPARRLMSLCNQCDLCREVCPEKIDMDKLFMVGRQKMHRQGKMPWPFHDYYLRDMEQANGEAALIRKPVNNSTGKEFDKCSYALFPGCQLGASEPEIIVKLYDSLLFQHPDTAMFLQCCGISADWAGDIDRFKKILEDIKSKWEGLGKPVMLMACMTCLKKFREFLPEIPVKSLYEFIEDVKISGGCHEEDYSIFNPCAARHETATRRAVADIAADMGVRLHPLDENEEYAKCCGYGGHGEIADSRYTDFVAEKRMMDKSPDGQFPYITYCINCRDVFKSRGKNAVHILELIYGMGEEKLPTVTERWANRLELKKMLLSLFWGEEMKIEDKMLGITLEMSDEIKDKLNSKKIFDHEIAEVIEFCSRTGRTIKNTETGTLTGYKQVGNMTYWVEYIPDSHDKNTFRVVNAYGHRLQIELEAVWNGVRKATEM